MKQDYNGLHMSHPQIHHNMHTWFLKWPVSLRKIQGNPTQKLLW